MLDVLTVPDKHDKCKKPAQVTAIDTNRVLQSMRGAGQEPILDTPTEMMSNKMILDALGGEDQ